MTDWLPIVVVIAAALASMWAGDYAKGQGK